MRPIYHRTDDRVEARIYVAALVLLFHRAIEKKLETARLDLSATEALIALRTAHVVDIDLCDGTTSAPSPAAPGVPLRCYARSASQISIARPHRLSGRQA